jgi:predicted nucleotidyltransferase
MRKKSAIDALFPATRQEILAALLLHADESWYLSDLAAHLKRRNPSSLQRELESLVEAGILLRRQEGNRVYFTANRTCPIFEELAAIFAKTTGLAYVVRGALEPLADRIFLAMIHGSIARADEHAASDVDLLIVGDVGLSELSVTLRKAERKLSRAINASTYSPHEFTSKVAAGNHFLTTVLKREKLYLIGNEDDLGQLVAERKGAAARHEQVRTG